MCVIKVNIHTRNKTIYNMLFMKFSCIILIVLLINILSIIRDDHVMSKSCAKGKKQYNAVSS